MSQEIDQRVVEMRFDNAQFEEHSRKTMRTLDKLKEKLRFDGAEKGIEKIQQASDDMDFSGMETGLDRLQEKFSALDVIAFTALQNITNKVMDTGEQMLKSLSVDQVTSGWDKYVEKTGNVQTIMNATGKSIDQVNGYLNKLMWYSDETSYSFDEMTSALSQMTASGGNIEKMIPMIMGIANATADAGKTGFAFQSTIRNLTQSYSAGYLQLQDWKSLNLMGTATKALKQELIDTATELGVIKKGDVTIASYENMLATVSETDPRYSYIQKDYEAFLKLNEAVEDGTLDLGHYADKMSEVSGREHLMQSLWNIWDAIAKVMGSVHDAFTEIFPPTSGEQIHSIAEGLDVVTKKLIISDDAAENLKKTFQVVFRVIKVPLNLLKTVAKAGAEAFGVLLDVLRPVGNVFLEVGAGMDDFLAEMQETILGSGTLSEKLGGITKSVKKLLDPLTSLGTVLKTSIGEKLAEVRGEISKWADSLPDGAKQAVNGLLSVLDGMVNGGLTLSGAVWNSLSGLKRMVETGLGAVADFVTGQKDTLMGYTDVLTNLPAIVGSAVTAFAEEFKGAAGNVEKTADGVFGPVKAFFTALKEGFDSISGTDIYRFMSLLDVGLMSVAFISFGKAIKSASTSLKSMLETPISKMLSSVSGSFNALTDAIKQYNKNQSSKTLITLAGAVMILAGAMFVMSRIDPQRFYDIAAVTLLGVLVLAHAAKALQPAATSFGRAVDALKMKTLNAANLWGTAAALLAFGAAVKKIADGIISVMDTITDGDIATNTKVFATVLFGVMSMMFMLTQVMGKLTVEANGKTLMLGYKAILSTAVALVAIGTALKLVASAVKPLSEIQSTSLLKAGIAVTGLMTALTGMAWVMMACEKTLGGIKMGTGASMVAMAGAVLLVAQAVSMVANADGDVVAATSVIISLMALMGVMGRLAADVTFGSGAGLVMMASAVSMMGGVAMILSDIPWQKALYGATELVVLGGILVTAGWALKKFVNGFDPKIAVSMMGIAASVGILAAAVAAFAFMVGQENGLIGLVAGFVSVAASLVMLGTALAVVDKVCKRQVSTGEAFMKMGVALLAIAGACAVFTNLVEPQSLLMAAGALVGVFAILMGAGFILEKVPLVGVALLTLTTAFKDFGKGLKDIGIGLIVFGAFSNFLKPFCEAIVDAAPDIQGALVALLQVICNTIILCRDQIAGALAAVVIILCQVIVDSAIPIANAIVALIEAIVSIIADLSFDLGDWLINYFFAPMLEDDRPVGMLVNWFKGISKKAANEVRDDDGMEQAGTYVAGAYANAIQDGTAKVEDASGNMAEAAINATMKAQKSHSPSKVFEELGQYCVEGYALGLENNSLLARVKDAMKNMAVAIREVFTGYWQIHSPSQLAENDGLNIAEGLALGMKDQTKAQEIRDVSYAMADNVRTGAEQALDAAKLAIAEKLKGVWNLLKSEQIDVDTSGIDMISGADKPVVGAKPSPSSTNQKNKNLVSQLTDLALKVQNKDIALTDAYKEVPANMMDWFKNKLANLSGIEGISDMTKEELNAALLAQYDKYLPDGTSPTNPTTTGKTKSSGKSKTLAETIAEQYTKELKANKYLQDAASKEYSLWEASEGDTASTEKLIEKKGENLAASIELQTERVSIAQRQYDELLSRVGENDDKTKDARATLLDEKKNLAELKKERYETLYKAAIERYESDDETAQSEYQLWADTYEKTASVTEKSNKQIEAINKRLAIQSQKTALAEKTWVETKEALGEASVEAQARYQEYLKQQQAEAELRNELAEAELDFYDKMSSRYENQLSAAKKRQSLLSTLYSDGDLSGRADAYASAVEEYGEDSIEARRAATQGTMTALMGVASAMNNMRFQLSRVTNAQKKYDAVIKQGYAADSDEALDAYSDIMDARSTFAEYMGDMADAFEVSDATKKAMMQIGDTMAKNWKNIQNGVNKVLAKVNPQVADSLKNVVGLYMRDGASETMAATANAIVAAMGGDWAGAVASGLSAVLNLVGTDFGRTLTEAISKALGLAFNGNGLFVQLLAQFFGAGSSGTTTSTSGGLISNILNWGKSLLGLGKAAKTTTNLVPTLTTAASGTEGLVSSTTKMGTAVKTAAKAIAGSGGLTKVLGSLGTTLGSVGSSIMSVASSLGPHGLLVGAVIAGTAVLGTAVVKNWDKVKEYVGNAWAWIKEKASGLWDSMKEVGGNLMSGLAKGVGSVAKTAVKFAVSPAWGIISGFKKIFGIASPSKVMAQIGVYTIEGLTKGIVSTGAEAEKGMEQVADGVLASAHTVGEHIADFMASDETAQPAIRPVVDLSEAARSSAWLDSAFADRRGTISMAATVTGQMAQKMDSAAKNQNGADRETPKTQSNRDVVEAVTALGERIDGIAKAVSNMKVELNGKKLVGGIKADMNAALGSMTR